MPILFNHGSFPKPDPFSLSFFWKWKWKVPLEALIAAPKIHLIFWASRWPRLVLPPTPRNARELLGCSAKLGSSLRLGYNPLVSPLSGLNLVVSYLGVDSSWLTPSTRAQAEKNLLG